MGGGIGGEERGGAARRKRRHRGAECVVFTATEPLVVMSAEQTMCSWCLQLDGISWGGKVYIYT